LTVYEFGPRVLPRPVQGCELIIPLVFKIILISDPMAASQLLARAFAQVGGENVLVLDTFQLPAGPRNPVLPGCILTNEFVVAPPALQQSPPLK
jgi:hypothetical protein